MPPCVRSRDSRISRTHPDSRVMQKCIGGRGDRHELAMSLDGEPTQFAHWTFRLTLSGAIGIEVMRADQQPRAWRFSISRSRFAVAIELYRLLL